MAEDDTGEVPKLPPDARLESLDERLDRLQQAEAKRTAKRQPDVNYRAGQLVLSQLVGAARLAAESSAGCSTAGSGPSLG